MIRDRRYLAGDMTIEQINTLSLLNGLIATCGGCYHGYSAASTELNDPKLKPLFTVLGEQRAGFLRELQSIGERFGGVEEDAVAMGTQSKRWKDLHAIVATGTSKEILDMLVSAEDAVVDTYAQALEQDRVMPDARQVAHHQYDVILEARERLKNLCE
jgi:uncharacterized protein (TIGR02284 family)